MVSEEGASVHVRPKTEMCFLSPFQSYLSSSPTPSSHLRSHGYQALAETLHNFRKTMDPLQLQRSVCVFAAVSLGG